MKWTIFLLLLLLVGVVAVGFYASMNKKTKLATDSPSQGLAKGHHHNEPLDGELKNNRSVPSDVEGSVPKGALDAENTGKPWILRREEVQMPSAIIDSSFVISAFDETIQFTMESIKGRPGGIQIAKGRFKIASDQNDLFGHAKLVIVNDQKTIGYSGLFSFEKGNVRSGSEYIVQGSSDKGVFIEEHVLGMVEYFDCESTGDGE